MRVFSIQQDGKFREYVQAPFAAEHEEKVLENWLEANPDGIVEDGQLLIIGRQVATDLGGFIDLLGIDREGNTVVIEIKRGKTPRDTLAQALEYVSFAVRLDTQQLEAILRLYMNDESLNLAEHHRGYFSLAEDEAVAFNKDQHIVIVGQKVTPEIRQTSLFLRAKGVRVTCVEFTFFQADSGTQLLSQEIVVGRESKKPIQVSAGSLPIIDESQFLNSLDDNGRAVFSRILQHAKDKLMSIHWGTKGFSLNVDLYGSHVAVCCCYPPQSVYAQSIYTTFLGPGGIARKTAVPEEEISSLLADARKSGLFSPAGRELKCQINRSLSDEEVSRIIEWLESVSHAVRKHGPKE